jgi:predicted dehydrogenase
MGVTFAVPMIVPGRVLGANDSVSPGNRITIGMIGTDRQATYANIPGFLREADAQIVAVCDVDSWRMENARKLVNPLREAANLGSYKVAHCRDFRDLLARRDIDAVMISTDHWHVPMGIAVKAGKDICCESR